MILAVSFNIFCFAYLFTVPYAADYIWEAGSINMKDSLLFSIANTMTVDYAAVQSINYFGSTLTLIETIITFVFLTIVLSSSIPQFKSE